jgi:DNA topoisomerase-1
MPEVCPRCGAAMVAKNGEHGPFLACSAFPRCRYTQRGAARMPCPRCSDGKVVEKHSRQGRVFYACHRYPECDFNAAYSPVNEKCPQCSSPYLLAKPKRLECPNRECGWTHLKTSSR